MFDIFISISFLRINKWDYQQYITIDKKFSYLKKTLLFSDVCYNKITSTQYKAVINVIKEFILHERHQNWCM